MAALFVVQVGSKYDSSFMGRPATVSTKDFPTASLPQIDYPADVPSMDAGFSLIEALRFQQFRSGDDMTYRAAFAKADAEPIKIGDPHVIPVGSIEFAEKYLGRHIRPINVPKELRDPAFSGREIEIRPWCELDAFAKSKGLHREDVFAKSEQYIKRDRIQLSAEESENEMYQFTTPLPAICSEWRIFVFRGKIVGCQCYSDEEDGLTPRAPAEDAVKHMILAYRQCPPAYTLDVAVCKGLNGYATFVVECHNLISCGLYGLDVPNILPQMMSRAWQYEINQADID